MVVFTVAVIVQEVSLPVFRSDEMKMAAHILPFFGVFVTWIVLAFAFTFLLIRRQVTSVTGRSILLSFLSGVIGVRRHGGVLCLRSLSSPSPSSPLPPFTHTNRSLLVSHPLLITSG